MSPAAAREIQNTGRQLRSETTGLPPRFFLGKGRIAVGDVAYDSTTDYCFAALVVWDLERGGEVWSATHAAPSTFPYIPGLLSFREIPPLLPLFRRVPDPIDMILCDGQGIAHPRRIGVATHLGVIFDLPAVGWAKSRLIGEFKSPGVTRGASSAMTDKGEQIGWALRSRTMCRPVFVSPGHRVSIEDSLRIARMLMGRYRQCDPARRAHELTGEAMQAFRKMNG